MSIERLGVKLARMERNGFKNDNFDIDEIRCAVIEAEWLANEIIRLKAELIWYQYGNSLRFNPLAGNHLP